MAFALHLETSTTVCSVAISNKDTLISLKEINDGFRHAEILTPFIEELLAENSLGLNNLNFISLSIGPGSYTGLRIGASVAKGLSYALKIPIVGVDSLRVIAEVVKQNKELNFDFIIPMIDARRMEVYHSVFDLNLNRLVSIESHILTNQSYLEFLNQGRCLFVGNSNTKAQQVISHSNAFFKEILSSSTGLIKPASQLYMDKKFLDTVRFEPLYLKQFGEK